MKSFAFVISFILTSVSATGFQEIYSRRVGSNCPVYRDVTIDYRTAVYEFITEVYKDIGPRSSYHFIFSPLSVWIILAAVAEGADPYTKQQLFRLLRLPNDPCVRLKYYQLATSRYLPGYDVSIVSTHSLVVDQSVVVNPYWHDFVSKNNLIDVVSVPFRSNPEGSLNAIKYLSSVSSLSNLDLSGNSVFVDIMDYNGLWSTAFSDAVIQRTSFYDFFGKKIGSVDMMRVTKPAKLGYLSSINAKVLDLPIGVDNRYRMLFALILDSNDLAAKVQSIRSTIVLEFMSSSRESYVPIDIAIPRFKMTSEINIRQILENLGVNSLWRDPNVTGGISDPAALPSGFLQRSTITLDNRGVMPSPLFSEVPYNQSAGLEEVLGRHFIANQPFMYAVFDTETYTCLMAALYSQPTYSF
ncbi:hypothetical protein HW555_006671 [Spodoptera exigua]|uniref:Serpin domain-containing protein n=1 Tax=Spodoptera exigua TaxID=7107 RepID=A0A835L4A7_SPOEX|nr:hypothetical protein HW555_006671 [Spodoptera exigua]